MPSINGTRTKDCRIYESFTSNTQSAIDKEAAMLPLQPNWDCLLPWFCPKERSNCHFVHACGYDSKSAAISFGELQMQPLFKLGWVGTRVQLLFYGMHLIPRTWCSKKTFPMECAHTILLVILRHWKTLASWLAVDPIDWNSRRACMITWLGIKAHQHAAHSLSM